MDFRNLPFKCQPAHTWIVSIIDHHTKFMYAEPVLAKSVECAKKALFHLWIPEKKIIYDNESEFVNRKLNSFALSNGIKIVHGSLCTTTTQGLVERGNRTYKEDLRAILKSSQEKELTDWCQAAMEAAYTMNITHHRAIN